MNPSWKRKKPTAQHRRVVEAPKPQALFSLDEIDSGRAGAPVVYRAAAGEQPVVSAGFLVPASAVHSVLARSAKVKEAKKKAKVRRGASPHPQRRRSSAVAASAEL